VGLQDNFFSEKRKVITQFAKFATPQLETGNKFTKRNDGLRLSIINKNALDLVP
jgi:hypothetical protein